MRWLIIISISMMLTIPALSGAQTLAHAGSEISDLETAIESVSKASSCKWKKGPDKVDAYELSPELLRFVGAATESKVKQLCQGTIQCDVSGMVWQSENYMICGMRDSTCDAQKCWLQQMRDRLAGMQDLQKEVQAAMQNRSKTKRQITEQHADSTGGRQ